jgi:hypothetical protein
MPNVGQTPQDSNRLAEFEASLDALQREPACPLNPVEQTRPYPGDHPCEIAGCGDNAPFGFAAIPRRVWFCKKHMEELCPMPILPPSSAPSAKPAPYAGGPARSPPNMAETAGSDMQLTLFNDGPSTKGS